MSLLHILLVDDEPYVTMTTKGLIQSTTEEDIEIFEAKNAEEALFWLEHSRIDLMITDIEMPDIDGIALIKIVHKQWPRCKSIILTAHSNFDYAYQAMQLGITDYLLKIETDEKLLKCIHKAILQIESEFFHDNLSAVNYQNTERMYLQSDSFRKLLQGESTNLKRDASLFGNAMSALPETSSKFMLVCARYDQEYAKAVRMFLRHRIPFCLKQTDYAEMEGLCCYLFEANTKEELTDSMILSQLESLFETVQDSVLSEFHGEISVILCPPVRELSLLKAQYVKVRKVYEQATDEKGMLYILPSENTSAEYTDEDQTIGIILEYIAAHMSEDTSLHRLSEITYFSTAYLSRFFHRKTGQTINAYIAQVKMKKIREMMKNEEFSLNEIAEQTGFESRSYFNRFVKRMTSVSPQVLRKSILR